MSVDHIYILIEKRAIPFQARRALDYGGCPGGVGVVLRILQTVLPCTTESVISSQSHRLEYRLS